ncbi:MAG: peptidase S9 [Gemmatimonadales bacterium]|nr:MAG: peptidase S9 [Gemmatimonadales bacterium]
MKRASLLLIAAVLLGGGPLPAQYFGQNKVQYQTLDFAVIQTEHFDIYYHEGERQAALDAARMAERAYARLSRIFNHQYRERQPIILFASHTEFQQNNVTDIGEGTGGVTEPFRHRILLPFTGSYADFEHVLQHEIVHQFQFDVFARGRIGGGIQRLVSVNPPLWFMEGMAEYLSLGPVTPETAMWLRDAALEGNLPTLEELTYNSSIFPYRFGHAIMAFIGERWGDGAIGELLHAVATAGLQQGIRRALGISMNDLSEEWRESVQRAYLPQIAELDKAHKVGNPLLNRRRSGGTVHVSPALSPDGKEIAYFSEGNSFFIDLYLADGETGRVKRRLIKSAFSSDFESLRFLYSGGSWSPDGRYFAIAVKHGGRDDLVIFDVRRRRVHRRIEVPLHGITMPSWSPDGSQLVFTGYDGGLSDLFIVNADGSGLTRLTNDRYADLHPAWSPDGATIAFATDRGPDTDFNTLAIGPLRIALYHLPTGRIELLDHMEGSNINPQWAPDGLSLAFVSNRTGIANVFLYDFTDQSVYQLTNIFTGVSGFTPISPAISWANKADRLAFTYYEQGQYNVYVVDNPRTLKRTPYTPSARIVAAQPEQAAEDTVAPIDPDRLPSVTPLATASVYRFRGGFRVSAAAPEPSERGAAETISVKALLDSAALALPDTAEFSFRKYSAKLSPDYMIQPSIGYQRDNFGNGFFGGTAISLSDMLGNRRLLLAGEVNGRIEEAQILVAYANLRRRVNWAVGYQQAPIFFYSGSSLSLDERGRGRLSTQLERYIIHQAFGELARPFSRFSRIELGLRATRVARSTMTFDQFFDPVSGFILDQSLDIQGRGAIHYLQPHIAHVFDNSISLWVGPFLGRRHRFEYSPAIGQWRFHQVLADYRRYDQIVGPIVFASRILFFGRFGRDDDQFPLFLGSTELIRGYTAGSFRRNECLFDLAGSITGCSALDQLIGSRIAVTNFELRFPLIQNLTLGVLPIRLPPIEGALFFDMGMAWNREHNFWDLFRDGGTVQLSRRGENKDVVRQPLKSWGLSIRGNLLGFVVLRADYTKPLDRPGQSAYWTLSLGPTF